MRRRTKATSVAGLEKKLDDIVTILSTSNKIPKEPLIHHQSDIPSNFNINEPPKLLDRAIEQDLNDEIPKNYASNLKSPSTDNGTTADFYSAYPSLSALDDQLGLDDNYAYALFTIFRCDMAQYCPFVIIPSKISPRQFKSERPFLWKAVITAASHRNPTFQDAFGVRSFENFITELLLRGQPSNLDKLQSITGSHGFHYQSIINNQTVNLIYLVKSMVTTLGLQRTSKLGTTCEKRPADVAQEADKDRPSSRRIEELRAYAGCFYATSMLPPGSSVESIRYTAQLDEACRLLAETQEVQSDILIFHLVKLQQISRKIKHTFYDLEVEFGPRVVPRKMCMDLFQRELESFKHELPENLRSNFLISINYSVAEINLYEAGLNDAVGPALDSLERLSILHSCLIAVKSFLEGKVTKWVDFSVGVAYTTWVQVGYGILVALKLSICKADGWNRDYARSALNIKHPIDFLIEKLKTTITIRGRSPEQLQSSTSAIPEKDIFIRFSRQLLRIKSWYEVSLQQNDSNPVLEDEIVQPFNHNDKSANAPLIIPESFVQDDFLLSLDDNFWHAFPNVDDGFWMDDLM
ncbi:hypothetical protein EYC80_009150 [Monilinia laxa]|uniref:Transcription factor domain-containing protein n=1 Tax=Monilinia laxa TaxID=61186 RepID=A0A5N6K2L5_MONLA|nr:hypothetical protein EYC80_009150 [Monilinia laxa]